MFFCVCVSAGATSRTAPPASGHLDSIKTTSSLNTNRPEGNKRFFGSENQFRNHGIKNQLDIGGQTDSV